MRPPEKGLSCLNYDRDLFLFALYPFPIVLPAEGFSLIRVCRDAGVLGSIVDSRITMESHTTTDVRCLLLVALAYPCAWCILLW